MTGAENLDDIDAACRLIARHYNRRRGVWAYEAFDYINATYFASDLPTPLIIWTITAHGACLALTGIGQAAPTIVLHPSLLGGGAKDDPWKIDRALLGVAYAFDVLIHECIHVNIDYRLGGWAGAGDSSHNNPRWVAEVNRLAPLLGLEMTADRSKPKRVPIPGQFTKTGKPLTKVARVSEGTVPFKAVATFPNGVRRHLGLTDFYRRRELPFSHALEPSVPPLVGATLAPARTLTGHDR